MRKAIVALVAIVVLAPLPAGASTTTDDFSRTVRGYWGSGALGAWSQEITSGAALSLSVSGGAAQAAAKSGVNKANFNVGPALDTPVTVSATVSASSQPSSGAGNQSAVLLRRSGIRTYYSAGLVPQGSGVPARLTLTFAKSGVFAEPASFTLPFAVQPGTGYRVAASVQDSAADTVLSAKAWPAGGSEPTSWQVSASDAASDRLRSGTIGVRFSLVSKVTMSLDDFTVDSGAPGPPPPPPPPTPNVDSFTRTVATSWGAGPLGTWSWETSSGAPLAMSVDGSAGRATSASGVNKGNAYVGSSRSGPVTVSASVAFDREPATGTQNHWHVLLRRLGIRTYYAAYLMPAAGGNPATLSIMTAKDGVFDTPAIVTLPFAVAAGTRYVIEARVGDDASGTTVQARAWPAGQTAPAWEASWTDVDADRILSGQVGVRISVYSSPATATVDDFTVTAA